MNRPLYAAVYTAVWLQIWWEEEERHNVSTTSDDISQPEPHALQHRRFKTTVMPPTRDSCIHFFVMARQPLGDQGFFILEASRSHSDTPRSMGLFWTSDQPDAETST